MSSPFNYSSAKELEKALKEETIYRLQGIILRNGKECLRYTYEFENENTTPLVYAICFSSDAILQFLLETDDELVHQHVVCCQKKRLPLHWAVTNGSHLKVEMLIKHGASVNVVDANDESPLHYACFYSYKTIVTCLVVSGANAFVKNRKGQTPLDIARSRNDHEIIQLIHYHNCSHTAEKQEAEQKRTNAQIKQLQRKLEEKDKKIKQLEELFQNYAVAQDNRFEKLTAEIRSNHNCGKYDIRGGTSNDSAIAEAIGEEHQNTRIYLQNEIRQLQQAQIVSDERFHQPVFLPGNCLDSTQNGVYYNPHSSSYAEARPNELAVYSDRPIHFVDPRFGPHQFSNTPDIECNEFHQMENHDGQPWASQNEFSYQQALFQAGNSPQSAEDTFSEKPYIPQTLTTEQTFMNSPSFTPQTSDAHRSSSSLTGKESNKGRQFLAGKTTYASVLKQNGSCPPADGSSCEFKGAVGLSGGFSGVITDRDAVAYIPHMKAANDTDNSVDLERSMVGLDISSPSADDEDSSTDHDSNVEDAVGGYDLRQEPQARGRHAPNRQQAIDLSQRRHDSGRCAQSHPPINGQQVPIIHDNMIFEAVDMRTRSVQSDSGRESIHSVGDHFRSGAIQRRHHSMQAAHVQHAFMDQ